MCSISTVSVHCTRTLLNLHFSTGAALFLIGAWRVSPVSMMTRPPRAALRTSTSRAVRIGLHMVAFAALSEPSSALTLSVGHRMGMPGQLKVSNSRLNSCKLMLVPGAPNSNQVGVARPPLIGAAIALVAAATTSVAAAAASDTVASAALAVGSDPTTWWSDPPRS